MSSRAKELVLALVGGLAGSLLCGCSRSAAEVLPAPPPPVRAQVVSPRFGPIMRTVTCPAK